MSNKEERPAELETAQNNQPNAVQDCGNDWQMEVEEFNNNGCLINGD